MKRFFLCLLLLILLLPILQAQSIIATYDSAADKGNAIDLIFKVTTPQVITFADFIPLVFVSFDNGLQFHQITEGISLQGKGVLAKGLNTISWFPIQSSALYPLMKKEAPLQFKIFFVHKHALVYGLSSNLKAIATNLPASPPPGTGTTITQKEVNLLNEKRVLSKTIPMITTETKAYDGKKGSVIFSYNTASSASKLLLKYIPYLMISFDNGKVYHLVSDGFDKASIASVQLGLNELLWYPADAGVLKNQFLDTPVLYRIAMISQASAKDIPVLKTDSFSAVNDAVEMYLQSLRAAEGDGPPNDEGMIQGGYEGDGPPNDAGMIQGGYEGDGPPLDIVDPQPYPTIAPFVIQHNNYAMQVLNSYRVTVPGSRFPEMHIKVRVRRTGAAVLLEQIANPYVMEGQTRNAAGVTSDTSFIARPIIWEHYNVRQAQSTDFSPFGEPIRDPNLNQQTTPWSDAISQAGTIVFSYQDTSVQELSRINTLSFSFDNRTTVIPGDNIPLDVASFLTPIPAPPLATYPQTVFHNGLLFTITSGQFDAAAVPSPKVVFNVVVRNTTNALIRFTQPTLCYQLVAVTRNSANKVLQNTYKENSIIYDPNGVNLQSLDIAAGRELSGTLSFVLENGRTLYRFGSLSVQFNTLTTVIAGDRLLF